MCSAVKWGGVHKGCMGEPCSPQDGLFLKNKPTEVLMLSVFIEMERGRSPLREGGHNGSPLCPPPPPPLSLTVHRTEFSV